MKVAAPVLFSDVGDRQELFYRQASEWNFDPHHLDSRLPLAVDAPDKPEASELVVVDPSIPVEFYLFLKIDDVPFYDRVVKVFQFRPKALHCCLAKEL